MWYIWIFDPRRSHGSGLNLPLRRKFDTSGGFRGVEIQFFLRILVVPLTPNSAKKTKFLVAYVNPGKNLNPYPYPPPSNIKKEGRGF